MTTLPCSLLALLACGSPQELPAQADARIEEAVGLFAQDRTAEGLRLLVSSIAQDAGRLARLSGETGALLADELEVRVVLAQLMAGEMGDPAWFRDGLAGVEVAPEHGALFARLAWTGGAAEGRLAPLTAWQMCGPFDNERGQGMLLPTPPERDPALERYEGKVREVAWRGMPPVPPEGGVLRLRRLYDPHQQSAFLLRTWIESPAERRVLLLVGASEELRVWCRGEPVFEALGSHGFAPDAFAIELELAAGWNELDLKVGSLDGSPTLVARLAEPESGAPLALASVGAPPEGVAPLALADPGPRLARSRAVERPGALRRTAQASTSEDLYRRALLLAEAQSVPIHLRGGLEEIEAARALAPGVLRYDLLRLDLLRVRGASKAEEDVNPWLAALDAALERHGELPRVLRARARQAWLNQPTYARALALLRRARAANPRSIPARIEEALVLRRSGQEAAAAALERELAADDELVLWPEHALAVARGLPRGERREELLAAAREDDEGEAIELMAEERRLAGDRGAQGVLDALAEKLALHAWSTTARRAAADTLLAQGHAREALAVLGDALALAPERAALHKARARAFLALGETELAIAALEAELEVDYGADDERRLLEHLRTLGATPFHEAFREPLDAVLARRAGDAPVDPAVAGREVLLSRAVVSVNPDGTAKRYWRTVERVLSESGARELDRRVWRVWAGDEEVRVLTASVRHPDGRVEEAKTGRTGRRGVFGLDLPPLASGDLVDLEWRHDDLRTTFFGNTFGLDLAFSPDLRLPVRESEIVLIAPDAFPLRFHERSFDGGRHESERRADGTTLHRWRMTDLAPRVAEAWMPPPQEDAPALQASSYDSWPAFGAWWWNLIEDEIRVSPEMRDKVAELVAGAATPLERLIAIYDFVVTEVRYNAWEFGVHGYQPYSAPVIFSRRFGDCKDKAILLRALLSEVGIEAWPVLLRSEPRRFEEDHTLPLVGHFNHCIAWVPGQAGIPELYLDGTARLHPYDVLPDSDQGARVLVVRADGVAQQRIPFARAEANLLEERIRVDLSGAGPPRVELERAVHGRWDPRERHRYVGDPQQRGEEVERELSGIFGALSGPVEHEMTDLEDLGAPVEERFRFRVEKVSRPTPEGFELPTSFDQLDLLRTIASEGTRRTDLLLDVPWSRVTEVEYRLGEGQRLRSLPPDVSLETEDARYARRSEATEDGVRLREELALKTQRIPVARYAAFRGLARGVDQAQSAVIAVEVGR